MTDIRKALQKASQKEKGPNNPGLDVEILMAHAAGITRGELLLRGKETPKPEALNTFVKYVDRRKAGEPVARIIGVKEFWSLEFQLNDDTLVPRPDSETLVEAALKKIPPEFSGEILDLGTGTGCLLLAILSERSEATGLGIDASQKAVNCAQENAKNLGLAQRAKFINFNWLENDFPGGKFDFIISNPPYIETREIETLAPEVSKYDPLLALDGGGDGLLHYRVLIPLTRGLIKGSGWVFFEIGETQEIEVRKILTDAHFTNLETHHDLAGKPRVVAGFSPFD